MLKRTLSGIMLTLLVIGMLTLAFNIQPVKAEETVYIRADGSVDPPDAPILSFDNVTYTFTDNINDSIVVEKDNIVVDGAGYTLQGTGADYSFGISVYRKSNITMQNMKIKGFYYGIRLSEFSNNNTIYGNDITNNTYGIHLRGGEASVEGCSKNAISGNNITNNECGVYSYGFQCYTHNNTICDNNITNNDCGLSFWHSYNNTVAGNTVTNNEMGIKLHSSSNNVLRNNSMSDNSYNFGVLGTGLDLSLWLNDVDVSNTVDGKPICFWISERGRVVPFDAGYVALINCTGITVQNLNLTNNWQGIVLAFTTNSVITRNNITNNWDGVRITTYSDNNDVFGNDISENVVGVWLGYSSSNTVSGNNITNNSEDALSWAERGGVVLYWASNHVICENNIINNVRGVEHIYAWSNYIYHNNIIGNTRQVYSPYDYTSRTNFWDDGYPSGGNYWSDYKEKYPEASEIDGSGIWDTHYVIDENNQDNYPLTNPWTPAPPTPPVVTATIDINPDTLNLKSRGKWITVYIELPEGYNLSDIDVSTIMLNDAIPAELKPIAIGDYDNDGIPDLMVKFDGTEVIAYILANVNMTKLYEERFMTITLTMTGKLNDGTQFQGSDTIRIMMPMPRGAGRHTLLK